MDKIKELTNELEVLDSKSSKYNLRSEQILFEIKQIVKSARNRDRASYRSSGESPVIAQTTIV